MNKNEITKSKCSRSIWVFPFQSLCFFSLYFMYLLPQSFFVHFFLLIFYVSIIQYCSFHHFELSAAAIKSHIKNKKKIGPWRTTSWHFSLIKIKIQTSTECYSILHQCYILLFDFKCNKRIEKIEKNKSKNSWHCHMIQI